MPPDYISYTLETTDGESWTGLVVSETAANITLRRPQQPDLTLSRTRVKELRANGKSLMPDGLELGLTPQDFADILAFLRNPDPAWLSTP